LGEFCLVIDGAVVKIGIGVNVFWLIVEMVGTGSQGAEAQMLYT